MLLTEKVYAMAPQAGQAEGGIMPTIIMFGSIILIMYFMIIRPQQKRQKESQNMLSSLGKGDKVITSAGMHGKIVEVQESAFVVEIANGVQITFEKAAIVSKKD
ncbi:MAG: preprotein translocase subunit YajC [Candidatus Kapabacteria bacterium]|nr:preprotein translocase subunit YajC [Candidatus Kapabacteria bacterium]